ncbi:MAG: 50S ribosomal protein L21 [Proteobacteria bacterium]|nr:50S ribosomal protein L21 [Pseudomonadota bacterium]
MFAVIVSGGKQHRVIEGEVVRLERLPGAPGEEVVFEKVLMVSEGDDVSVGQPYVTGSSVKGEVISHLRGKKVNILKFKRRQGYMRRQGHRQWYTEVRITGIQA